MLTPQCVFQPSIPAPILTMSIIEPLAIGSCDLTRGSWGHRAWDDPGVKMAQLQFGSHPNSESPQNTQRTPSGETKLDELDLLKNMILEYKLHHKVFICAICSDPSVLD